MEGFDTVLYADIKKYVKGNINQHGIESHIPIIAMRLEEEDYEGAKAIKDAVMEKIDSMIASMKPHLTSEEIEKYKL